MPNKKAKLKKQQRFKLNLEFKSKGRTAKQRKRNE